MDIWLINMLITFGLSVLLTGILIPQILLIAFRKKLFDVPDARKIHTAVVPRLGGMAFMPAVFFSIACVIGVEIMNTSDISLIIYGGNALQICFIACAMLLMFLVGMADDLVGVRYSAKFAIQIIAAIFLVVGGLWIGNLHGFLFLNNLPQIVGVLLTILVIVFIINAINLIDGIDGLASGLSAIALLFYGIAFYSSNEYFYAMLSFATLGTLVPFFYFNVFGDPGKRKKIFMGDTGALTIGVVLSTLAIKMSKFPVSPVAEAPINPLVVAFSPLIVPCFDVVRVYLHRITKHRNPFLPDKCHIHHKVLALGVPQRVAMISILTISALFIIANVLASPYVDVTLLVVYDLIVWTVANYVMSHAIRRRQTKLHLKEPLYD